MNTLSMTATRHVTNIILGTLLCSLLSTSLVRAEDVLSAGAKPHGYSLAKAAAATAYFNTGVRTPENLPSNFPFQVLYYPPNGDTTFSVRPGKTLYVPVVYSDDTDSGLWAFPNVNDPRAVSDYYFSPTKLGADSIEVVVDGEVTELGRRYATGAATPGLPDGANNYTVVAVFISPLSRGTHTVTIRTSLSGGFIQAYPEYFPGGVFFSELTYTVIVGR